MSREKAIEAAVRTAHATGWPLEGPLREGSAADEFLRRVQDAALNAAAPHIESALLDRIEEKVWGLRMRTEYQSTSSVRSEAQLVTLGAVLAILTEIRQGQS